MPWIGPVIGAVAGGLMGGSGGSTGGAGANMYVPTGLGYADTGWQQNQQANQNQLNYGGYGNPQSFMGGATDWGSLGGWGGGGGYPQGGMGYPGGQQGYGAQSPGAIGGYGQNGPNLMTNGPQGGGQASGMPQQQGGGGYAGGSEGTNGDNSLPSGVLQGDPNYPGSSNYYGGSGGGGQQQQPSQTPYQGAGAGGGLAGLTDPAAYQSYALSQGINYNPYLQASQQAGQQFGGLANQAGQVGNSMYGEGAYALGTQGQLGQQGNQFLGQQQQLAGQSQGLGYGQLGQSQQLAGGLQQAGQQVYNTAADPQNALYNQQFQQATDQANATNSMYGLGSSGAGAGITNQAQQNFNTNWENQQLARQQSGLQAMTGANQAASGILGTGYGGAQQGLGQAGTLGSQGVTGLNQLQQTGAGYGSLGNASNQAGLSTYAQQPGYTQNAAQVPLNAQQYVAGQPAANATQYASNVGQLMAPYNQQQNQAIPYMNYGSGAGSNAYANLAKAGQLPAQQAGAIGSALGQAGSGINWSSVGNWFNPQGSGGMPQQSSADLSSLYSDVGYGGGDGIHLSSLRR